MSLANTPFLETSTVADPGAAIHAEGRDIEAEVIGHLRIWHMVGIGLAVLTSAVFLLCCCCNFRVPRTRQQIEENYLKRKVNKRYLRLLERNPEELLNQRRRWPHIKAIGCLIFLKSSGKNTISVTDSSGKVCFLNAPQKASHNSGDTGALRSRDAEASTDAGLSQSAGQINGYTQLPRLQETVGVQTPTPFRPRDILAMMAQQPRLSAGQTQASLHRLFDQRKGNRNHRQHERPTQAVESNENTSSGDQTV